MADPSAALAERVIAFIHTQMQPAWLVGGYVRDRLLHRTSHDLDVVVPEGGIRLARAVAAAFGGASFVLDHHRDVGRAIVRGEGQEPLEVDVARLRVPDLLDDLALRDFTVNAIAMEAADATGEPRVFDPFDGRRDLDRRLLRAVTEGAFRDDPLRMLRAVRHVAEIGFRIEDATYNLIRRDSAFVRGVAAERVRDELLRILAAAGAWQHLRLMGRLELLPHILPETAAQVGVAQSPPHYQDVFDHTRSVLAHLEGIYSLLCPDSVYRIPQPVSGDSTILAPPERWAEIKALLEPYADDLRLHLSASLASGHSRLNLLVWAAVAHDWGKPAKRTLNSDGRTRFLDHDRWGALLAETRLQALRLSGDEVAYVARLTDVHMRPGLLASDCPPTRRAVYRFYRDAAGTGPDCVVLSLADHVATHANRPDPDGWQRRSGVTRILLDAYFRNRAHQVEPAPFLTGHQIMAELGLEPGPEVGRLLEGLREAQAAGDVMTVEEAREWMRAKVGH